VDLDPSQISSGQPSVLKISRRIKGVAHPPTAEDDVGLFDLRSLVISDDKFAESNKRACTRERAGVVVTRSPLMRLGVGHSGACGALSLGRRQSAGHR
jgi:hypothetical protein